MRVCFLLLGLFIFSCQKQDQYHYPRIIVPKQKNVIEVNSKEMLQNQSPLLALNFLNDTRILPNIDGMFECRFPKNYIGLKEKAINKRYDLKVFIDTTYKFSTQGIVYKNLLYSVTNNILKDSIENVFYKNKLPFDTIRSLQRKFVSAYPVLFYNNTNKKIPLGTGNLEIKIIQEAKDIDNKWKPIEFNNSVGTCLSPSNLLLEPKHYTASAVIKYKGNFKTRIRVKYFDGKNVYYSNEINGTINRSQFNQQYLKDFVLDVNGYNYRRNYNEFFNRMLLKP